MSGEVPDGVHVDIQTVHLSSYVRAKFRNVTKDRENERGTVKECD